MKHVRKSFQKHASGSLDVGEDPPALRLLCDVPTILLFPLLDIGKEAITILFGLDVCDVPKDVSELLGIRPLGIGATPLQSLSLDVDQTPLDSDARPQCLKHPYRLRVAVYS